MDCTNCRDGEKVFIYRPLENTEIYFVREQKEFFEKFEEYKEETTENIILLEGNSESSFEIRENGKVVAELNFKQLEGNRVEAYHTFVDNSLRGKGIAEKLYQRLLEYVKEKGYTVVPSCSYIAKRMEKDSDYLEK